MKKLSLLVSFLFLLIGQNIFSQKTDIQEIENQIEVLSSDDLKGRKTGSAGLEEAANYISKYFKSIDIMPYYESYKDTFYIKESTVAYNIIAHIEGSEKYLKNEPIIIGAHYDHIGIIKPVENDSIANGANDNISGVVGVMQLANLLKDSKPKRPILFVLFDAEEQGLLGSTYIAEKLKSEDINPYVIFNIEMIGVPMTDKPQKAYLTGYNKSNFAEYFNSYLEEETLIFSKQAKKYQLFKRSDNYPFYESFDMPAHSVSTFDFTNYDYYHHVDDEASLMDAAHIQSLVELWHESLLEIANHTEKLIKITD